MIDYRSKTLEEIRLWAWAAAVLPMTSLAGLWFIWAFGTNTLYDYAMIIGFTVLFGLAVIWWWWAIYTIRNLTLGYNKTKLDIEDAMIHINQLNHAIKELIPGANHECSNNDNKFGKD